MAKAKQMWGVEFPGELRELDIWLWRYAHDKRPVEAGGPTEEEKYQAFKTVVDMLWNVPESTRRVIWNPWTDQMFRAMVKYRYVGLAGCGSSGKSDAAAVFSLVEWLAAPTETMVLITSTTIQGAKKRVWKSVTELWNALEARWTRKGMTLPGKMVASKAMIVGLDINNHYNEGLGLSIVAADTSSDEEASKKLKGLKAPAEGRGRLRLIADELPDLGRSVNIAGFGNLNTNPDFKMIALGNPRLKLDPFGEFCLPDREGGYKAVTAQDYEWETNEGVCIRFDASLSPRLTEEGGDEKYPWMPSRESIDQMATRFGEDSAEFWSQVRGMWPPDGLDNAIWAEGDLLMAESLEIEWDKGTKTQMISALDIPYTSGGDRAIYIWGECGISGGVKKMKVLGYRVLSEGLTEENINAMTSEDTGEAMTANLHLINQYKTLNLQFGIKPKYSGIDSTAGGIIFGHWVQSVWKPGTRMINFGTKPEERVSAFGDDEKQYGNRVAQLWVQPKPLVRENQIGGIPRDVTLELCQRKFSDKHTSGKLWIEEKKEMKKRLGESPDLGDAFCILVEVAILNNLLEFEEIKNVERDVMQNWKRQALGDWNPMSGDYALGNPAPKSLNY